MTLFSPYISLPLILLSAWFGLRQGAILRDRGFTLRQRLALKDLPGINVLLPFIILVVPPFLLLRNYPAWYWYFPMSVQLHAGGVVWTLMASCFFHVAAIVAALASRTLARHTVPTLLALLLLASATEYAVRQSPFLQPPTLRDPVVRDGVILQTSDATCAAAALANIAGLYGMPRTEREMVELMGTTAYGTNIAQVYDGIRKLGLNATPKRIPSRDFNELQPPAILFVAFGNDPIGHAVCYIRKQGDTAEIWNPQGGKSLQTRDQLAAQWQGHALEVSAPR